MLMTSISQSTLCWDYVTSTLSCTSISVKSTVAISGNYLEHHEAEWTECTAEIDTATASLLKLHHVVF